MKYGISIFAKVFAIAVMFAFGACTIDDSVNSPLVEFGATANNFTVNATAGHVDIKILSNQHCVLRFIDQTPWAELNTDHIDGDGSFYIDYDDNAGFPRMTRVVIEAVSSQRRDTVLLKQRGGITPAMTFPASSLVMAGRVAGVAATDFETNIDFDQMKVATIYTSGGEGWISDVSYADGKLQIGYNQNPAQNQLRTATVTLGYINGWHEEQTAVLYLVQKTSEDSLGENVDFDQVRNLAVMGVGTKISDFIIISGYVVSDIASGNVGENPKSTATTIDYSNSKKTFYLESLDGRYGFCVETATEEDNIFERYDKVQLLLSGVTITGYEDPDCYTLSGITASMIVGRETGSAEAIPQKKKYISELTDDDIYTFVTLQACEFPIRKGALTPVHEGYTLGDNKHMLSKYPRLMRDSHGANIYLYTNTTCPYRRDGKRLPYGSGDVSGVVVHEYFSSYVYGDGYDEDTQGNIGRYQLRHMAYEDIQFAQEDSFSTILTEYRYIKDKARDTQDGYMYWYPTYGNNGRFTHSQSMETGQYPNGAYGGTTWNCLGPVGSKKGLPPFNNNLGGATGLGIILEDGTDYLAGDKLLNVDGKGQDGGTNSWSNIYWWDDAANRGESWRVEFSTKEIVTEHLSMQISVQGGRALLNCSPIYWKTEWSLTGDLAKDADWSYIASYQIPDFPVYATYRDWQLPAFKQIDFELPLEMLGYDKIFVRFTPEKNTANTLIFGAGVVNTGVDGKNQPIFSGSAMDYFAVRYNK